jgi:hypothetical protein
MFEHHKSGRQLLRRGVALWLLSLSLVPTAAGFDTAPHYDLTHVVLTERGFGGTAIKVAQVLNWMTDYYATTPALGGAGRKEQKLLEQLHCDNLDTAAQVKHYLGWLLQDVKNASQLAAQEPNPLDTLTILAVSLHAVQDFYAHSNWVELHPRTEAAYRTETFLSDPAGLSPQIVTGKVPPTLPIVPGGAALPAGAPLHGGYTNGLNKDSPIRPGWDEAYVFAYAASHELVALIEKWSEEAQPGHWDSVRRLQVAPADEAKLGQDLEAARNVSMWVAFDSRVDGHWKGDKSGAHHLFTTFLGRWETAGSSVFARQIKDGRILGRLTQNLSAQAPPPDLPVTSGFALRRRALVVRTNSIRAANGGGLLGRLERIDLNGEADFYALFRMGQQTYRERVIQGADEVTHPWYVIHFVDQSFSEMPVNIAVWDEDESEPGEGFRDDRIDINPQPDKYDFDFVIKAADPGKTFTLSGAKPDKNRASISFTVTQIPLQ